MTPVFFSIACFHILFAQVTKIKVFHFSVNQHPVGYLLPDKEFIEIKFTEIIGSCKQIESIFLNRDLGSV